MATTTSPTQRTPGPGREQGKVLRACVVQGGRVLEDQHLKPRAALTLGTGPKNTFVVSEPGLARSHTLFENKGGRYELVFTEGMKGTVLGAQSGVPVDFATLKSQGLAKRKGALYRLHLSENHRGNVIVGETTIIFQFVVPPPTPAPLRLPASIRGNILESIDWPFTIILLIALVIEAPIVIAFQFADPPKVMDIDDMANNRFAKLIIPEYEPKEDAKPDPKDLKGEGPNDQKKKDLAKSKKAEANEDPEQEAKRVAAKKAGIRKQIAGKGILAILGTAGDGSTGGAVADVFGSGSIGGDLDSAFEGISGVGMATSAGETTTRGGGTGEAATIAGLATSGGGKVGLKGKSERKVGAVKAATPEVDGSLDRAAITKVVQLRMRSIQDCYEKELKRDSSLQGKIEVEFTIGDSGRVEEAEAVRNSMGSEAVASCIVSRIRRWRFPKPDGGSVTVSYPFIFTASG